MATLEEKFTPFLTFPNRAEEAMNFYVSLFDRSEVLSVQRWGPNEPGEEGSVMHAAFSLQGQQFMCSESNVAHAWSFTPAISLYVRCESEAEIERLYQALSDGGRVFMELAAYPFSERFAWVGDRYGVTWQLALDSR